MKLIQMNEYRLHLYALNDVIAKQKQSEHDKELLKRCIFHMMKVINLKAEAVEYKDIQEDFQLIMILRLFIQRLTPSEFMSMYPINKYRKGDSFGETDYFHTINYIKSLNADDSIENSLDFLFQYTNSDVVTLVSKIITTLDKLSRLRGEETPADKWARGNGIRTVQVHTDVKGNKFIINEQGKTERLHEEKPRLQLI